MRFEHDGMVLWYGTPDAPAPTDAVPVAGGSNQVLVTITVGVQPPSASNVVQVGHRVNGGPTMTVTAGFLRHDIVQKAQYFAARLPALRAGDTVTYSVLCRCAGRQVPAPEDIARDGTSFRVTGTEAAPTAVLLAKVAASPASGMEPGSQRGVPAAADGVSTPVTAASKLSVGTAPLGSGQPVTDSALHTVPAAGTTSLGEILTTVLPSAQQKTLLTLAVNYDGSPEEFWTQVRAHPEFQQPGVVDKLQLTLQLGLLTQNHLPLIQALQGMAITSPRDLAKLDAAAWTNLLNQQVNGQPIGVPASVPDAPLAERTANYVNGIVSMLQAAFPTEAVAQIAAKAPNIRAPEAVKRFFANASDFDIRTSQVDTYVKEHEATAFNGIAAVDQPVVVAQVKSLQRVFQVSASPETMSGLLSTGLDSAHAVANIPRKSFLALYAAALGGEQQAAKVYARAQFLNARTLHIYTQVNEALNGVQAAAMGCDAEEIRENLKQVPNSANLFGSLDWCDCEDCRSVLSPAAYLVDLLEFLCNSTPNAAQHTPLDILIGKRNAQGNMVVQGRRPDLEQLPLTCENTNTTLPYIDLVNEVFESYVTYLKSLESGAQPQDPSICAHDTGDATAQELDANPQYTNEDAYKLLDQAVYPFTLPFNQPIALARTYLEHLGSSRYEVLNAFKDAADQTLKAINREYLAITEEEYNVLIGKHVDGSDAPVRQFYGYDADDVTRKIDDGDTTKPWNDWLANAVEFLQRTGIVYTDLVDLLLTRFINPQQRIVLYAPDSKCDLSVTCLQHLDGTLLGDAELGNIHRFIRLWRKLGWSIADLDRALTALTATDINDVVLHQLAHIKQLQDDLKISSLQVLLSLWAPIDTYGDDSLYKKLFLNKAMLHIDAAFQVQADGAVLSDTSQTIAGHIPALLAALRVSETDLAAIRSDAGLEADTAVLSLANVSTLYRYAVLAKALRLRILDLLALKTLSGLNPFVKPEQIATPEQTITFAIEQTIAFVMVVDKVKQSGFTVAQLNYLYRHLTAPPANFAPQPTTLLLLAKTLRDSLTQIAQDNTLAPDPTGDLTRVKLALLFDGATVDEAIGMINGSTVYSAPLATLPDALASKDASNTVLGIDPSKIPALAGQKVSYDPTVKVLRFQGTRTATEQAELLGASADPAYQTAVNTLFQQPVTVISGTEVYAAPLATLPDALASKDASNTVLGLDPNKITALVAPKVSYDPAAQVLRFQGAMTTAEQTELHDAGDSDPVYRDAIDNLSQLPLTFIQNTFSGFLDVKEAQDTLVRNTPSLDHNLKPVLLNQQGPTAIANKFAYLLGKLLPYLITQLSHALAKQTIADALKLDGAMAQLLLETVLTRQADPSLPGIADLLAFETSGLTARYFTSNDLTGTPTERTDGSVAFDGSSTMLPTGTRSARWSGMLLAPNDGAFTFRVHTSGGVQLWIGDLATPLTLTLDAATNAWVSTPVTLAAGQLVNLRLELTNLAPNAIAELYWQSAMVPNSIVPANNLFPDTVLAITDLLALSTPGLTASYFASNNVTGPATERTDPSVVLNASGTTPDTQIPASTQRAHWYGLLLAPNNGDFIFTVNTSPNADVQLWVGSDSGPLDLTLNQAINAWVSDKTPLKAGQLYSLRLEVTASAPPTPITTVELRWQSATVPKAIIPATNLYPGAEFDAFAMTFTRLQKAALMINSLKLTVDEVAYLSTPSSSFGFDLNALPLARDPGSEGQIDQIDQAAPALFAGWQRVNDLVRLRNSLPQGEISLVDVFAAASLDDAQAKLAQATGWDPQIIAALTDGFNLGQADFKNGITLLQLQEAVRLTKRLGVSPQQLFAWADLGSGRSLDQTFTQDADNAQDIKKTVQAKYDEATWLAIAKPLNDKLRESQRDALVAYLLPRMNLTDANQLFEFFLIDPQMSACMETSRIKQALSSVQLFVQRCLMNLENDVSPSAIDADQWEWRKHYRVWEANRKIFLWPENWVESELRDDKSPFFQELESELLQNDLTTDTAETAFLNYLEKIQQVARLEVVGMYFQDKDPDTQEVVNILHVFARTFHTPHIYFYRCLLLNTNVWTPWEKVTADIQGDHLIPVIWNRRLYIFWPIFTQKAQTAPSTQSSSSGERAVPLTGAGIPSSSGDSNSDKCPPPPPPPPPPAPSPDPNRQTPLTTESLGGLLKSQTQAPQQYWEISLAWSEYKQGKWSSKQVAKQILALAPSSSFGLDTNDRSQKNRYVFRTEVEGDALDLLIHCEINFQRTIILQSGAPFTYNLVNLGTFTVGGCTGETISVDDAMHYFSSFIFDPAPVGANYDAMTFAENPQQTSFALTGQGGKRTLLNCTPTPYRLLYPHQYQPYFLQAPFFYQDARRTFFVSTSQRDIPKLLSKPNALEVTSYVNSVNGVVRPPASDVAGAAAMLPAANTQSVGAVTAMGTTALTASSDWVAMVSESGYNWSLKVGGMGGGGKNPATVLKFEPFHHPFVCDFIKALTRKGIPGLLTEDNQRLGTANEDLFCNGYQPTSQVERPYPVEGVDLGPEGQGAYSLYNWELFFHAPLLIATRLSQNQRFQDAVPWFHYIFNPTSDTPDEQSPARYWKVLPFKTTVCERIDDMMQRLNCGDSALKHQVEDWQQHPFQPHRIARLRLIAYQKNVFMKYLDNLLAWGDQLFQQDTIESINEAEQLYVLAANLLGLRPQRLPSRGKIVPETYASLRDKLDAFSNAMRDFENAAPFSSGVSSDPTSESGGLLGMGRTLYFCIPPNDKLLSYWDTVADRLFKIRHCMNIEGVVRQLPLFEPPIDPALLVQAAAQGVDLGSVLSDLNASLPNYRFSYMLQKALEMCVECRSLGASLLSTLEKKDAEELALLRATHETNILNMMEAVKKQQVDEDNTQIDALMKSRDVAIQRYQYYQLLLNAALPTVPDVGDAIQLAQIPTQPSIVDGGTRLLQEESLELDLSHSARDWQGRASTIEILSSSSYYIPTYAIDTHFWGLGVHVEFGGQHVGPALNAVARYLQDLSAGDTYDASHAGKMAGYFRRGQEWSLQSNLAASEIMQIDKQIAAANIRAAIAQQDLTVHQQQMQDAQVVQDFMSGKFTNQDLYVWMSADLSATYFQCYQLAYELAKKAERAFRFERGVTDSNFIQFGYWDSLRKGLLSGERLYLALKQMERAYLDQNKREYEITKHVSLVLNDPLALITLKETGQCVIELPEALFDADYPGHYMRRMKSVSLTIPCVVGPYTSINCTLTLLSNKTRISSIVGNDDYAEDIDNGDDRFVANFAAIQSIAMSHAQNDSGLFELNFRDERYLPFEGAGAISRWRIDLPKENNAFDFNTLSDVVLHLKYTAREGGDMLRRAAQQALKDMVTDDQNTSLARLFSLKHEFPTEWYRFLHPTDLNTTSQTGQTMQMDLSIERFPFQFRGKSLQISSVELFLSFKDPQQSNADYQQGDKLTITLPAGSTGVSDTSAGSTGVSGPLESDPQLCDMPHLWPLSFEAEVPLCLTLGVSNIATIAQSLRQPVISNGEPPWRLNVDAINDVLLVCHYRIVSDAGKRTA